MALVGSYTLFLLTLAASFAIISSVHFQLTPVQRIYPKKVGDHYVGQRKTDGSEFPIYVIGGDDASFFPKPHRAYTSDREHYDVVIVGGGLSGLVASLYLTDRNKKVLILEKEKSMGGLAAWR